MESILDSIKKLLGIQKEYTHFDSDLIMHINTVLSVLTQLGIGPTKGFSISDNTSKWKDFIGDDPRLESVRSFIHLKVKLLFDPPMSSAVIESINHMIEELEWRLTVIADTKHEEENKDGE